MARFAFDGEQYRQAATHQREWGLDSIAGIEWRGDERILDLGCGDGTLTARLAELVPAGRVVGIDAAPGMIAAARSLERGNLEFVLMDIDELDGREEFDLIFSNAALHWVKDHVRLLATCYRVLRPGGALRFNFGGEGNCVHLLRVVREVMDYPRFQRYFAGFEWPWFMPSLAEYEGLLGESVFREFRVWGENRDRFFPDTGAMIRWLDQPSLVPFMAQVAAGDRSAFRGNVIDGMVGLTLQPDGTCFETFRRINVLARK